MKICLTNLSYSKLSFNNFLKKNDLNLIKNFEVAPTLVLKEITSKKYLSKIKLRLKEKNINFISIQSVFFGFKPSIKLNKNETKEIIKYFKKIIKFANYLNIKKINIGSAPFRKIKMSPAALFDYNLKLFSIFSDIALSSNINVNIEPISKKYKNLFLNNFFDVYDFVKKKLKKKNIKIVLDTGNCDLEKKNFKKIYRKYHKIIDHIQISEKNLRKIDINKIEKILLFLKKENFNKTVAIEYLNAEGKKINLLNKMIKKNSF